MIICGVEVLSTDELMKELGFRNKSQVTNLISKGLRPSRIGKQNYFAKEKVQKYIKGEL